MKRIYFYVLVGLLMLVGCQNQFEEQVTGNELPKELYASFADDTKVQLNSATQTVWTEDDEVSVFYKNNANGRWLYMGKTGARGGALTCQDPGTSTATMSEVVVFYPYSDTYELDIENRTVAVNIPSTQYYTEGSYGVGGNLMVSVGTTGTISLESVCGWLKVQLKGTGKVKKVTLKGNAKEQLAGDATLNYGDLTLKLLSGGGSSGDDFSLGGELVFGEYVTIVTLDCGEGVMIDSEQATSFYLVLAPQTFAEGITITATCEDGTILEKSSSKSLTITRNTIQPMAALQVNGTVEEGGDDNTGDEGGDDNTGDEGDDDNTGDEGGDDNTGDEGGDDVALAPAANEIWYTSKYDTVLAPYLTTGFGANVTTNVYEDGKGVITFDGDISTIPADAFKNKKELESVTIPSGVISIGYNAFSGCSGLISVDMPDSITSIGNSAFGSCNALENIDLPQNLLSIGNYAFSGYSKITTITIPNSVTSIGDNAFSNCSTLTSITIGKGVTAIGADAFYNCSSLAAVHISDLSAWCKINFGTNTIGTSFSANPCYYAKNLYLNNQLVTDLVIPNDITTLKARSFYNCTSIKSITLHDEVTSIGEYAFSGCSGLGSITIPMSLKTVGTNAFSGAGSSKAVYVEDLEAWCNITFASSSANPLSASGQLYVEGTKVTDLTLPNTVISIKDYAFYGAALNSVTLHNRMASVGISAFAGTPIKTLSIGTGMTTIGKNAFQNCSKLTKVVIPDNIVTIEGRAFNGCSGLSRLTIGSGVKTIGQYAFANCTSLTSLTIPDNVNTIDTYAFSSCSGITNVTMGKGVTSIGSYAFNGCSSLAAVFITDLAAWCGISGHGSGPLQLAKNLYLNDVLVTDLVIPETVTTISSAAFSGCASLKSVTIPDNVTSIGDSAFAECISLENVNIGAGVKTINADAFYKCSALPSIVIPANVKTIGNYAFRDCSSLKDIYLKHTAPYVTSLGNNIFTGLASEYRFYVPMESVEHYTEAWSSYASRIVGYNFDEEQES